MAIDSNTYCGEFPSMNKVQQLTLNFEPTLADRFGSSREFLSFALQNKKTPMKTFAADMDLSPSTLSRKLNPGEGDTQRFNIDDVDKLCALSPEIAQEYIAYLIARFVDSPDAKKERVISRLDAITKELPDLLAYLNHKEAA